MARRKLPPLPARVDATSAAAIPALLSAYVSQLPTSFQASTESLAFRDLVENDYPAAWKSYVDAHWARHFYEMLTEEVGRQRHQARRAARTATNKARVKRDVTAITHSVDNHGQFKRLLTMNRLDVAVIRRRYESAAENSLVHVAFWKRIEKRLKTDEETIGDRWKVADLEKLSNEFYGPDAGPVVP